MKRPKQPSSVAWSWIQSNRTRRCDWVKSEGRKAQGTGAAGESRRASELDPGELPQVVALDSRGGGLIAFYSERDGDTEIFVMNADGSGSSKSDQPPLCR